MPRPRQFDEAEVIAAARDQFWRRGYAGTSIDDLTAATGLGKGSLYGAFGDKRELFLRALDAYIGERMHRVRDELRDPRRPACDRLTRHLRAQVAATCADTTRRGCMMANSAAELGDSDPAVERMIGRAYREWGALLAECIGEAQRDGAIDSRRDVRSLATVVLAFLRGQEGLRKGGVKPAQLKAGVEEMITLL
ncbi:TetR/AcrR family transcriptional regulator [Mycolicibacterium flavescens]|uniref:TetR family transcriptional regulator n=1 Tax=Mycolicibacterium flavescens TaxID=1776 RepID=A0A1E3RCZ7_MYCFV|nr:TetR/AcrR family transcriptional regulator [Mycolicibacterium flavescens]MCV7278463.1 TetR/AcrR family transcriptional regulator [Mycolicibacterium flavescens]ODQ87756.1 TetR family transcriptional regulator [Mycolicibacterium flavescens]